MRGSDNLTISLLKSFIPEKLLFTTLFVILKKKCARSTVKYIYVIKCYWHYNLVEKNLVNTLQKDWL